MITAQLIISDQDRAMLAALEPANLAAFLRGMGKDMVTQARKNITEQGSIAGKGWAPLSKPYAKRKRAGKTPGHAKFGGYSMLQDTGEMFQSLRAEVIATVNQASVGLYAEGERNDKLLTLHSEGSGHLPRRNPTDRMALFEARFLRELEKFMAGLRDKSSVAG